MAVAITVVAVAKNGYADTLTYGVPVVQIYRVRNATAAEISNFSTALTAIESADVNYNQKSKVTFLTATATATVITALNA
jgi:hypothetical protein